MSIFALNCDFHEILFAPMTKTICTSIATIRKLDEDLIRLEYDADCVIDVEHLEESLPVYKQLMGEKKFYLLTIFNEGVSHTIEARLHWLKQKRSSFKIAEAFVINGLPQRIIASFVMKVTPPTHKVSYFKTEKEAMAWLNKQRGKKK